MGLDRHHIYKWYVRQSMYGLIRYKYNYLINEYWLVNNKFRYVLQRVLEKYGKSSEQKGERIKYE